MQKIGPVVAWIVDDTGFPKQGKHSVGVARQYCGEMGKSDNCQAAVSLSASTWNSSIPIAWRLFLPEVWCQDSKRCREAGVPEGTAFQTKPEIALQQIRQAIEQQAPAGVVMADAGYGKGTQFRADLTELGLPYVVGIESNATVWQLGRQPLPARARNPGRGATPKRLQRSAEHQPISVKQLAQQLPLGGTVFPPQPAPAMLDYQPRRHRPTSAHAGRRVRPERHNPNSIATLRT